jgi:DNA-binding transcriptional LysR family regulator
VDDELNKEFPVLATLKGERPDTCVKIASNDLNLHKEMVLGGVGVAVLPEFMVRAELEAKILKPVWKQDRLNFPLKLVTRRNQSLSQAAKFFIEELAKF